MNISRLVAGRGSRASAWAIAGVFVAACGSAAEPVDDPPSEDAGKDASTAVALNCEDPALWEAEPEGTLILPEPIFCTYEALPLRMLRVTPSASSLGRPATFCARVQAASAGAGVEPGMTLKVTDTLRLALPSEPEVVTLELRARDAEGRLLAVTRDLSHPPPEALAPLPDGLPIALHVGHISSGMRGIDGITSTYPDSVRYESGERFEPEAPIIDATGEMVLTTSAEQGLRVVRPGLAPLELGPHDPDARLREWAVWHGDRVTRIRFQDDALHAEPAIAVPVDADDVLVDWDRVFTLKDGTVDEVRLSDDSTPSERVGTLEGVEALLDFSHLGASWALAGEELHCLDPSCDDDPPHQLPADARDRMGPVRGIVDLGEVMVIGERAIALATRDGMPPHLGEPIQSTEALFGGAIRRVTVSPEVGAALLVEGADGTITPWLAFAYVYGCL